MRAPRDEPPEPLRTASLRPAPFNATNALVKRLLWTLSRCVTTACASPRIPDMSHLRLLVAALALALPLGCGGKSTANESSGGSSTGGSSTGGSSPTTPQGCSYDGKRYASGDSFPATDGCNSCSCDHGSVSCTEMGCSNPPSISCEQVETFYDQQLQEAKKCDPHDPNACSLRVGSALGCGCETFVNPSSWNPDLAAAFATHYSELACGAGVTCGECDPPGRGVCSIMQGCMDAYDSSPGPACKVDGVIYPDGAVNIPDPTSCNTCTCNAGTLACNTDMKCPRPCPTGSKLAMGCAQCGPTDACEVVETSCRPTCTGSCPNGLCIDGACLVGVCR